MRNPKWHRDEIILALDLYFDLDGSTKNASRAQLQELSSILNNLPQNRYKKANEKFRNPNGVNMKLANFKFYDPNYSGEGLKGGSALDREIFFEFNENLSQLKLLANSLKYISEYTIKNVINLDIEINDNSEEYIEGGLIYKWHKFRERNPTVVKKLKKNSLQKNGKLVCEVCSFDFSLTFGNLGYGYIEAHHKVPLALLKAESQVSLKDFALLCANCHRMAHRAIHTLSVDDLRKLVEHNRPEGGV